MFFPSQTLYSERLHQATLPVETQLQGGTSGVWFGLVHGLALGSDLYRTAFGSLMLSYSYPGLWQNMDVRLGFQFLDSPEDNLYGNGWFAYNTSSYRDSNDNYVNSNGFILAIQQGYQVTPLYSQGVGIQVYRDDDFINYSLDKLNDANAVAENARKALRVFYKFKRQLPQVKVALPADVEIYQWKVVKAMAEPIHLYVHADPSYARTVYHLFHDAVENRAAINVGMAGTYAPKPLRSREEFGHYAVKVSAGLENTFFWSGTPGSSEVAPSNYSLWPSFEAILMYQF